MSRARTVIFPKVEIENIKKVLGLSTNAELARFCKATPSAVGFYIKDEAIPLFRLKILAVTLEKEFQRHWDNTSEQVRAREFVERATGMAMREVVADAKIILEGMKKRATLNEKRIHNFDDLIADATGSATALRPNSPVDLRLHYQENADAAPALSMHTDLTDEQSQLLRSIRDDRELVRELERRGWEVSLRLKGKI